MTTAEAAGISVCAEHPCSRPVDPVARFPQFCRQHAAAYAAVEVCRTDGCGYPVTDVEVWADRARDQVPRYWLDRFIAEGTPASPNGLCAECGAGWLGDLERFREDNSCDGYCSPYDHCMCRLMLPEDEW